MIAITSQEAAQLRMAYPQAVITMTGRQSSRRKKRYYVEESQPVMALIRRMRQTGSV